MLNLKKRCLVWQDNHGLPENVLAALCGPRLPVDKFKPEAIWKQIRPCFLTEKRRVGECVDAAGGGRVQQKQLPRDRSSGKMGGSSRLNTFLQPMQPMSSKKGFGLQKLKKNYMGCPSIRWVFLIF